MLATASCTLFGPIDLSVSGDSGGSDGEELQAPGFAMICVDNTHSKSCVVSLLDVRKRDRGIHGA